MEKDAFIGGTVDKIADFRYTSALRVGERKRPVGQGLAPKSIG